MISDLTGNLLRTIKSDSFSSLRSLTWLRISRNKIQTLERDAFKALPFLEFLDLTRNSIRVLPSLAFNDLPSLENISLARNDIYKFEDGVFFGCDSLMSLNLSSNRIHHISDGHLFELYQLHTLDLSHNRIISFEPSAWAQVKNLKYLTLHANRIQALPAGAFKHLSNLETLILSGNAIDNVHKTAMAGLDRLYRKLSTNSVLCDCHMKWFSNWLYSSKLDRSLVTAKCAHPPQLGGIHVLAIDASNLTCSEDSPRARVVSQSLSDVKALVGETANLLCSAYGQAPISIEWRLLSGTNPRVLSPDQNTLMNTNRSRVINGTMNGQELAVGELILLDVTPADRANYQCVVRNRFGTDFGKPIFLDVQMAPKFIDPPQDMSLLVGQNAKIMCAAAGMPQPSMKWAKDGGQTFPAATERRLHVRPQDDNLYFLNVTVDDAENKFHTPLIDTRVEVGETVIVDCLVDLDTETQRIVWLKDNKPLTMADYNQGGLSLKADQQILVIHRAVPTDSGNYSCELWAGNDFLAQQTAKVVVGNVDFTQEKIQVLEPETLSSKARIYLN
ncbi:hypothetical protein WR25_18234 [Diploscapter pachys]|uniref:Ig-like domain-containing protein n=1 Tax=Diploscapter pachys TaxID=2018661 RepID=A0A2A2LEB3_9BILA|nr:hypothetical protein WR25_18234 [Diploscapter pachys]